MPYAPHTLVSVRGGFGGTPATPSELWSFGLRFEGVRLKEGYDTVAPGVLNAVTTFLTSPSSLIGNAAFLTEVRLYGIGADGRASDDVSTAAVSGTPPRGGAGSSNLHPWQVSHVVTLDAQGARRGRFGRVYLPCTAAAVDQGVMANTVDRASLLAAFRSMVNSIETGLAGIDASNGNLIVASSYGTNRPVQEIGVGRRFDIQRRRANRLAEDHLYEAL